MKVALWIIAIVETIRMIEQSLQLRLIAKDTGARDNAYAEFIKSLKTDDREFVRDMLEEFDRQTESKIARNSLRSDCNGCRFVGWDDTEFPCANCTRKSKDYYDADTSQTESYYMDATHFGKAKGESTTTNTADTPQTDVYDYKGNGKWERSE